MTRIRENVTFRSHSTCCEEVNNGKQLAK